MSDESNQKKVLTLTPDQFEISDTGDLIIRDDDVTHLVQNAPQNSDAASESGGVKVSVTVSIGN
jgi:hypothetical protein